LDEDRHIKIEIACGVAFLATGSISRREFSFLVAVAQISNHDLLR
jgi:hypothetical protein